MTDEERLAACVGAIVRTFLVEGRKGAPAEGRLRFNPLHFHLLGTLAEAPRRPSDLADILGVPRTTLSTAAEKLARDGLIDKTPTAGDGRGVLLALTEAGRETARAIRRQDLRNAAAMLAPLTAAQRRAILPIMERVAAHLQSDQGSDAGRQTP
ncbi:MAG: MarR family winged helix-turn-helix transcriptional regulator [Parvularculaceae bacterium]